MKIQQFQHKILSFYKQHKRDLPWRTTTDPYKILVSEIMLQQTQVDRVKDKYREFIKRFPTFKQLAAAPQRDVISMWQGLGYNRRALNLHKLATIVSEKYYGRLPDDPEVLETLPGIGKATAGSISAVSSSVSSVPKPGTASLSTTVQ